MMTNINANYLPKIRGSKIKRRSFLFLGSAFSASFMLPIALKSTGLITVNNAKNQLVESLTLDSTPEVGFWHSNTSIVANNRLAANLISAQELPSGDLTFAQYGARIKIHGLYLPDKSNLQSLTVYVHHQPRELQREVKVIAGSYTKEPITNIAAPTNIFFPVEQLRGIKLSLEWKNVLNASSESQQSQVESNLLELSLGNEESTPKLQRGTYLITRHNQSVRKLSLGKDYQIRSNKPDDEALPYQMFQFDQNHRKLVAVDFPYLLISIDYDQSETPHPMSYLN